MKEDANSIVLFFVRNERAFPVVIPDCSYAEIEQEARRYGRLVNAVYVRNYCRVSEWNEAIANGIDVCKEQYQTYLANFRP